MLQLWTELVLVFQLELLFVAEMESHLVVQLWTGMGLAFQVLVLAVIAELVVLFQVLVLAVIAELVVLFQVLVLVAGIADWSQLVVEFGD